MNPWIASDLAKARYAEPRRTAELRRQASGPGRERARHVLSRRVGALLIRAGRRLGGEPDVAAPRPPLVLGARTS